MVRIDSVAQMLTLCVSTVKRYYFHFVTDGLGAFCLALGAHQKYRYFLAVVVELLGLHPVVDAFLVQLRADAVQK